MSSLAVATVLVGLVAALVVGTRGGGSQRRVDQAVPGPVLLVPGYGGSPQSLASLARSLRALGRDVTVVTLPDRGLGDLVVQATALDTAAREAMDRSGAGSVDVVGYSAGGVVARLWVEDGDGVGRVRRLVTLGSPHHGTQLAALGGLVEGACPVACQQLAPGSGLLQRLDDSSVQGPTLLSLWTTQDDVVVPPTSAVLDGVPSPSVQSICPQDVVRHSGLPDDRVVQRVVAESLTAGPIPTWGPGDCARLSS